MNALTQLTERPSETDPRALDILLRARQAFVDKGFDGASMQDLARAAGMSVGNFYRYFPSKAAIIEGLIKADMAQMDADFAQMLGSEEPMAALRFAIRQRVEGGAGCRDEGLLWAEMTAAALRKPELAAIIGAMEDRVVGYLCAIFARAAGTDIAAATAAHTDHARYLVMLVKAAGMMRVDDPSTPGVQTLILQTIDNMLGVVAPLPKD